MAVDAFNARLPPDSFSRLAVETVIPEPFVGAVLTAPVVVLQLNPGFDPRGDPRAHAESMFRRALLANLRHERREWPFYFLEPTFRDSTPGGLWWQSKVRKLIDEVGPECVAERVAVVEWFPYKSTKYRRGCVVSSQRYGFGLVSSAIARDALIVISRSVALWESSVPSLRSYPRKLTLSSNQNVALSPNNLKHRDRKTAVAWSMLTDALRQMA